MLLAEAADCRLKATFRGLTRTLRPPAFAQSPSSNRSTHAMMTNPRTPTTLALAALAFSLLWSSGCSTLSGFHRDWNSPCCCAGGEGLAGCWEGCWESHCTGHHGKLQAIISKVDETHYCARFHGTFFKFLPFEYSMLLSATPAGDGFRLAGQKDLGKLAGGVYRYEGQATACDFLANYKSCKDRGVFVMRRRDCNQCSCCR